MAAWWNSLPSIPSMRKNSCTECSYTCSSVEKLLCFIVLPIHELFSMVHFCQFAVSDKAHSVTVTVLYTPLIYSNKTATQILDYYYQLYQLGTGRRTQKDLACTRCLPKAIGAYVLTCNIPL